MMTYFLLFCLLLSHTEAKPIPQPPPAPSPHHFPLDSWPKDSLLPRHRCPPPAQRDHFWLVHTWPMGFCSNHSVNCALPYLRDKLTIHGWWPVNKTDRTLNNNVPARLHKKNHLFTGEAGAKLYKDMINEWPDLRNLQEPKAFWEREWAHHGICSGFEAQRYFGKALALKRHLNIFQALTDDHGIKPGAAHPRHTFERALQRRSIPPKSFAMRCGNKNGIKILIEIRVCTNEIHAIPCSRQLKDTCGGHGDIKNLYPKLNDFNICTWTAAVVS